MNRREARRSMGSRTARRSGTKTKVVPKSHPWVTGCPHSNKLPKFRYPRSARPLPKTRLAAILQANAS